VLAAVCLLGAASARSRTPGLPFLKGGAGPDSAAIPGELNALLSRAVAAANDRNPEAFAPLAVADGARTFDWVRSRTSDWEGEALAVPTAVGVKAAAAPVYLAVFHAWHTCESDGDHIHTLVQTAQGWRLGPEIPETETGGFRVRDHDLRVALDVPARAARIADCVRVERTQPDVPAYGLLRLSQDFRVSAITRDHFGGAPVAFRQAGGVIAFAPPAEKTFTLCLQYAGIVDHRGSDYIADDEATLNSYWYPHSARLPATATVTITAPPGWEAIAPGERTYERRAADGTVTVTYRNEVPISFLTLDAGRYTVTTRPYKDRTLAVYLRMPDDALANRCLDTLERTLAFYEARFGPYPYTRYSVVETQGPFGGALEAYSFATFGRGMLPGSIPHELAHTWWGGLVACTYTRSMWNESFAEYSSGLFYRETVSSVAGVPPSRPPRERLLSAAAYPVPLTQARDTGDSREAAVGYSKGARVLRVLESELGEETMGRCLAAFVAAHPRGLPAEWADFEAVVRQVTGKDYRWFFSQWTERPGLPALQLANVQAHRAENGAFLIAGDILQSGEPYRLSVPLRLELRDGSAITQTVPVAEARTRIQLRAPAPPQRLLLDPEGIVPLALPFGTPDTADPTTYEFADLGLTLRPPSQRGKEKRPPPPSHCKGVGAALHPTPYPLHPNEGPGVRSAGVRAASLNAFLRRAAHVINRGDRAAIASLCSPESNNPADWFGPESALPASDPANARPWRALSLALPAQGDEPPQTLAVFSRYHPAESQGDHVFVLGQQRGQWRLGREISEAAAQGVRLRSHRAQITLEPGTGTLRAVDRCALTPDRDQTQLAARGIFLLRLGADYTVDSLRWANRPVWFRQAGGVLAVRLPDGARTAPAGKTAGANATATLEIAYHGRAAQSGEDFITPTEAALSGYWLPHTGRQPATCEIALTVPRGWMAFTQGVAVGKAVTVGGRAVTFTYRNALPVCYPSLAAGPFRLLSRPPAKGDPYGITVAYLHAGDRDLAQQAYQTAQAALHFYHTHFAPFPYPRFTVVISARYRMALEGYSMTTIARGYVPNVLPHEIAHTWWGGFIPNTYLQDMWDEALAEYSDGLYARRTGRRDSAHEEEIRLVRTTGILAQAPRLSLLQAHDPLELKQALIGYMKGSLVLETLEAMLGRGRMLACLRAFVARRVPGEAATWQDFARAVTATAGAEWQGFFDAWLSGTGLPGLRLENVHIEREAQGNIRAVTAEIAQEAGTAYWLNVPVVLSLKDGSLRRQVVPMKAARATVRFEIAASAKPDTLEIDPQSTLLRAHEPSQAAPTLYRFEQRE